LPGFLVRWPLMVVHQLQSALQESLYLQAVLHNVEVGHNTDEKADFSRYIPGHNEQSIVQRQEVRGWTVSHYHKWCFLFLLLCILDTWITYPENTDTSDRNGQEENLEVSSNLQKIFLHYIFWVIFFITIYVLSSSLIISFLLFKKTALLQNRNTMWGSIKTHLSQVKFLKYTPHQMKIANHFFFPHDIPDIMMYQHTKFGYKCLRVRGSENILSEQNPDRQTYQHQDSTPYLLSLGVWWQHFF